MNTKEKKEKLNAEFNKNQQLLNQLLARQEQIKGQYELLDEIEKEEKPKEEKIKEDK